MVAAGRLGRKTRPRLLRLRRRRREHRRPDRDRDGPVTTLVDRPPEAGQHDLRRETALELRRRCATSATTRAAGGDPSPAPATASSASAASTRTPTRSTTPPSARRRPLRAHRHRCQAGRSPPSTASRSAAATSCRSCATSRSPPSSAVFRQVGPMVGSFDAGYGTWYLEETIGRKRAKEMWYLNRKYTAREALEMGLVNEVVPHDELPTRRRVAEELLDSGPQALAAPEGGVLRAPPRRRRPGAARARPAAHPVPALRGGGRALRFIQGSTSPRARTLRSVMAVLVGPASSA